MNSRGPPGRAGGRPLARGRVPPFFPGPPDSRFDRSFDCGRAGRFFRGGRECFGRGGRFLSRGDGGRLDPARGGGRLEDMPCGRIERMSSYSSLGRGIRPRLDDQDARLGRVASGSYAALASMDGPPKPYAAGGGPEDRGTYSSLADNIETRTFAMMGEVSQPIGKRTRPPDEFGHDGMGFGDGPLRGPPLHMHHMPPHRAEWEMDHSKDYDRIPDVMDRAPQRPHPMDDGGWPMKWPHRERDRGPEFVDRMPPGHILEDQFGRLRPPQRDGFARGYTGRGPYGRGSPNRYIRDAKLDDLPQEDFRTQPPPKPDNNQGSIPNELEDADDAAKSSGDYVKSPEHTKLSHDSDPDDELKKPDLDHEQNISSSENVVEITCNRAMVNDGDVVVEPLCHSSSVDVVPLSPRRVLSPEPAAPSLFAVAFSRMVEMNADMEFAYAKLRMLEYEHERVVARLQALEQLSEEKTD